MAGLIQDNMAQSQAPAQGQPQGGGVSHDEVIQNIKVPPELQEAYDKVVIAGMKVMFDKATHQLAMKAIEGDGPIGERVGKGIAGLIATLYRKSNNTIPPQVIVPATVNLVAQACDFLKKSGQDQISDKELGDAIDTAVRVVITMFGADPDKMIEMAGAKGYDNSAMQQQAQQMGV
jgi:hypothetical protein